MPIVGEIEAPGFLEGGDFFPMGQDLAMVGIGLRRWVALQAPACACLHALAWAGGFTCTRLPAFPRAWVGGGVRGWGGRVVYWVQDGRV